MLLTRLESETRPPHFLSEAGLGQNTNNQHFIDLARMIKRGILFEMGYSGEVHRFDLPDRIRYWIERACHESWGNVWLVDLTRVKEKDFIDALIADDFIQPVHYEGSPYVQHYIRGYQLTEEGKREVEETKAAMKIDSRIINPRNLVATGRELH